MSKQKIIAVSVLFCFICLILRYFSQQNTINKLMSEDVDINGKLISVYEKKSLLNGYHQGYRLYYKDKRLNIWRYLASFAEQKPDIEEVYRCDNYTVYLESNTERLFIDYSNRAYMFDLTKEIVKTLKKGYDEVYDNYDLRDAEDFFMVYKPKDTSTYYGKRIEIIRIYYNLEW